MKKVIVTGANGFIGRHLLKELIKNDVEVFAVARKDIELKEIGNDCNKIRWIKGDLSSKSIDSISNAIITKGGDGADCFYHLAWNGVAASDKNNYEEQIKNIEIGKNAITLCKRVNCRKFVNLGTAGEYVSLDGVINENWVPSPGDIYGAMKVAVRNLLSVLARQEGIEIINTILCSTFGEYRSDDNVISYTIKKLLRQENTEFGSLKQMWDFLYVDDAVYALYLIGEKGTGGKTYSIGSGTYRPLYEYIEVIRDKIDPAFPLGIGKLTKKYEKVMNSCVDTFQLQKDTGFRPRISFDEGIDRTIKYFRENI